MKKLLLIFFIASLVFGQSPLLTLFSGVNQPELNPNLSLDFVYTEELPNNDFANWTGDNPDGWTVSTEDGANYVTENPLGLKLVSDGTNIYMYTSVGVAAIGHVYQRQITIDSLSGTIKEQSLTGVSKVYSSVGTFSDVVSATSSFVNFGRNSACSAVISKASLIELISPTGFITPTMNATNYVVESSGCKFIEATGATYIEMEDTLASGNYYVTVDQVYANGELNAYNGTSETAFPTTTGTHKITYTSDGTNPLRLQVDNNSNITVTRLSIKKK